MATMHRDYPNCRITTVTWAGPENPFHHIGFTDSEGGEHIATIQFDPVIAHCSNPKNRLHRWLLQPGTICDIGLPQSAAVNMSVKITTYADSLYITGEYRNYEGDIAIRTLVPLRVRFEETEWHKPAQFILTGWDKDKQAERGYALKDFNFRAPGMAADQTVTHYSVNGTTEGIMPGYLWKAPDITAKNLGRIREFLGKYTALDAATLVPSMTMEDLDIDSLEEVDMLLNLEDEFEIRLMDESLDCKTIGDLAKLVALKLETKNHG